MVFTEIKKRLEYIKNRAPRDIQLDKKGCSEETIIEFEAQHHLKLPSEYKDFQKNIGLCQIGFAELFGLGTEIMNKHNKNIIEHNSENKKYLVIGEIPDEWIICIDITDDKTCKVYVPDYTQLSSPTDIEECKEADSLKDFIIKEMEKIQHNDPQ